MRFGKIAITLLVTAALIGSASIILKPGWGSSVQTFVRLIIYISIPVAFVFGIVGTILDRRKFFAISTVVIIVSVVLYIFVCSWLAAKYGYMLR